MTHKSVPDWEEYTKHKGTTYFPLAILMKYSGDRVLDIGCGHGQHLHSLGEKNLKVGLEISLYSLTGIKSSYGDIHLVQGSSYQLPFKNGTFETVIMIDVIEHFVQPDIAMQEVERVLQNNGRLILQTPNYPIKRLYDFVNYVNPAGYRDSFADDPTHVSKFSWYAIEKLIRRHFKIIYSGTRNLLAERRIKFFGKNKTSILSKCLGQKTIIIAVKTRSKNSEE